jgi:drug/metabolite transporter (DMT)-like permease
LAASAASIFFGASVVATRYVVPQTTPVVLAFVRYVVATSCLLVVLGRRAFPVMPGRDRLQVALLGVLFFGVFPWSFSASLTHLPTAQVALIAATNALVPTGDATTGVSNPLVGYLEIGTTALCGATYNVWSRPLLARYDALAITAQSMLAGTVALAPLALAQGLFSRLPMVTPLGWAAVLFLGIFGGAVGFGLWIWALRHSTPSRVAVFLALNPITAITLGVVLLGESAGVRLFVALAMVIAGIQLASKKARASD